LGYKPILDDFTKRCLVAIMKLIHFLLILSISSLNAIFAEKEPKLDDPKVQDQIIAIAAQELDKREKANGDYIRYLPFRQVPYTGWWVSFYANGQVKELRQYKNGKPDGLFRKWIGNGEKQIEGNYKDGKKDGLWFFYNEDGTVDFRENYKDGEEVKD
jgi:hypothetical protein